jgi:hypothetical protein
VIGQDLFRTYHSRSANKKVHNTSSEHTLRIVNTEAGVITIFESAQRNTKITGSNIQSSANFGEVKMFTRNQKHKVKIRFEIGITEVVNLPSEVEGQSIHLEWRRSKKPGQFGETSKVLATKNQLMGGGSSKNTTSVPSSASFSSSEQIVLLSRISLEATTNKFEKKEIKFTLFATKTTSSSQKDSKKLKKLFAHSSSSSSGSITTTMTLGTAKIDLAEFAKNGTSTTKFIPLGKKNPPSLVLTFNTKWLKVNNKDLVE